MAYLPHDAYYRDLKDLPLSSAPRSTSTTQFLETDLMVEHINQLKAWQPVELPVYDFTRHSRTSQTIHIDPQGVIIVEGILIFAEKALRELFDIKIFVDTDSDCALSQVTTRYC